MSSILVPVDFSESCHNAYGFALQLAKKFGFDIILSHYYGGTFSPNRPLMLGANLTVKDTFLRRLESFAHSNTYTLASEAEKSLDLVKVSYEASVALSPSAAVLKRSREKDIALIVMATRSSVDVSDRWLGSNATTVSESTAVPVFLVPPQAVFQDFERVVVANHHETAEPFPLWQIQILAQLTGAKMHFVNVDSLDEPENVKFSPWKLMEVLSEKDFEDYEVVTVDEKDITAGLLDYAVDIEAQLLVIVNRLRAHWRSVLHPSLTQHIALRTDIPLLVLHTTQKMETQCQSSIFQKSH